MTPTTGRAVSVPGHRRIAGIVTVAIMLSGFGLSGCSIIKAVNKVRTTVEQNKGIIDTFTTSLKSGEGTTFEATYMSTGSSPATVLYAVKPPKGLAFSETQTGSVSSSDLHIVVNTSGEYACTPPTAGAGWTCRKLPKATAAVQNEIFNFYTPAHWVFFLKEFALAAGFAGDKISTSSMTVNGFSMQCVDFQASGVRGTSTICSTSQHILGYVKVATSTTTFEIKSYTAAPSASLFALPAGAKITTTRQGNS